MALKYKGGAFIHGIPARDLTDEEEARYGASIKEQERLTGLKLYSKVKPPVAPKQDSPPVQGAGEEKEAKP